MKSKNSTSDLLVVVKDSTSQNSRVLALQLFLTTYFVALLIVTVYYFTDMVSVMLFYLKIIVRKTRPHLDDHIISNHIRLSKKCSAAFYPLAIAFQHR